MAEEVVRYFRADDGSNFYDDIGGMSIDELMDIYREFEEETLHPLAHTINTVKNLIHSNRPLEYIDSTTHSNIQLTSKGIVMIVGKDKDIIDDTKESFEKVSERHYNALEEKVVA